MSLNLTEEQLVSLVETTVDIKIEAYTNKELPGEIEKYCNAKGLSTKVDVEKAASNILNSPSFQSKFAKVITPKVNGKVNGKRKAEDKAEDSDGDVEAIGAVDKFEAFPKAIQDKASEANSKAPVGDSRNPLPADIAIKYWDMFVASLKKDKLSVAAGVNLQSTLADLVAMVSKATLKKNLHLMQDPLKKARHAHLTDKLAANLFYFMVCETFPEIQKADVVVARLGLTAKRYGSASDLDF